jgi:hypothetical protein
MTRAEQFAVKAKKAKEDLEKRQQELRAITAARRLQVGTLADTAGLLAWDDAVLRGCFGLLATLATSRTPVEDLAARIVPAPPSVLPRNGHGTARPAPTAVEESAHV